MAKAKNQSSHLDAQLAYVAAAFPIVAKTCCISAPRLPCPEDRARAVAALAFTSKIHSDVFPTAGATESFLYSRCRGC